MSHSLVHDRQTKSRVDCSSLRQVVAAEPGRTAGVAAPGARDQGHADRAHHAVVGRDRDRLAEDRGECRRHRVVVSRAALEVDDLADRAARGRLGSGSCSAIEYARPATRFGIGSPLWSQPVTSRSMNTVQRSPSLRGRRGRQREARELVLDADPELLGLLLEERPGAGGAGLVHREVDDDAVLDGDVLGVLPADLEDRVHRRAARAELTCSAPVLCAVISSLTTSAPTNSRDQFAAGPGRADARRPRCRWPQAACSSARPCCTASIGRPAVRR